MKFTGEIVVFNNLARIVLFRCSKCLTKNYCSRDCQLKDWEEKHQELCNNAAEKRKVKGGAEARVKSEVENVRRTFEEFGARSDLMEAGEQLSQVKEAYQRMGTRD